MRIMSKKGWIALAITILLYGILSVLNALGWVSNYILFVLMVGLINAILTVSLNVITGFTGQFSIGHAGFMAIGAYVSAVLTKLTFELGFVDSFILQQLGFFVSLIAGAIAAAIIAALIGIPTLRLQGDYLAIATLGFNQVVVVAFNNLDVVGGPRGFTGIPKLSNFTWVTFMTIASVVIMHNFIRSVYGVQCIAIREDEIAAESLAIHSARYKNLSFTLASFFAGLAGGLLAHLIQLAHPTQFTFLKSIDILLMLVVGGMASIPGSIVAGISLTILPEVLRFSQDLRLVIYPVLLIIFVIYNPLPKIQEQIKRFSSFLNLKGPDSRESSA